MLFRSDNVQKGERIVQILSRFPKGFVSAMAACLRTDEKTIRILRAVGQLGESGKKKLRDGVGVNKVLDEDRKERA